MLFRSDLGEVRVHEGAASERAVRSVGADAFAVGPDVHLSHAAAEDERVLAHEVAHTVQARGARRVAPVLRPDDAPLEREADRAVRAVLSGDEAEISAGTDAAVVRRFGSEEHRQIGEEAALGELSDIDVGTPSAPSYLTFGDLVLMGGGQGPLLHARCAERHPLQRRWNRGLHVRGLPCPGARPRV